MSEKVVAVFTLLVSAFSGTAFAAAPSVQVAHAWARATAPGQKTSAVYMDITSDANAALVGTRSPAAERAELHSMSTEGGVMRMRPLLKMELPAGKTVKLAPNGAHLMLVNLKRPLKAGETVPVILSVQSPGSAVRTLNVKAEVHALTGPVTDSHGHKH